MAGSDLPLVRARDEQGHFIGDDPSTPDVDEAWVLATETNDTNGEGAV